MIDTHGHAAHIRGGPALAVQIGAPYHLHPYDAIHLIDVLPATILMTLMSPGSSKRLPVSRMNYFGVGAKLLRSMMKEKNVSSLEEMISLARELGVRVIACEMSRDVMGIKESELVDRLEHGEVASFLADSLKSRTTLFI